MPLHLVPAIQRQRKRAGQRPASMLQCPRCGGREVIDTKIGVLMQAGKTSGGTKQTLCAGCFAKGERVVLA